MSSPKKQKNDMVVLFFRGLTSTPLGDILYHMMRGQPKKRSNADMLRRNLYTLRVYRGHERLEDMISNAAEWRRDLYRRTCQLGRLYNLAIEVRMPMYTLFKKQFAHHLEVSFADQQLAINATVDRLIRRGANLRVMEEEATRLGVTLAEMLHPDFSEE